MFALKASNGLLCWVADCKSSLAVTLLLYVAYLKQRENDVCVSLSTYVRGR